MGEKDEKTPRTPPPPPTPPIFPSLRAFPPTGPTEQVPAALPPPAHAYRAYSSCKHFSPYLQQVGKQYSNHTSELSRKLLHVQGYTVRSLLKSQCYKESTIAENYKNSVIYEEKSRYLTTLHRQPLISLHVQKILLSFPRSFETVYPYLFQIAKSLSECVCNISNS